MNLFLLLGRIPFRSASSSLAHLHELRKTLPFFRVKQRCLSSREAGRPSSFSSPFAYTFCSRDLITNLLGVLYGVTCPMNSLPIPPLTERVILQMHRLCFHTRQEAPVSHPPLFFLGITTLLILDFLSHYTVSFLFRLRKMPCNDPSFTGFFRDRGAGGQSSHLSL